MSGSGIKVDYGRLNDMYIKAIDERNLYRKKAMEETCKRMNNQCQLPNGDFCEPWKHGYCPEVIKEVDSCTEKGKENAKS